MKTVLLVTSMVIPINCFSQSQKIKSGYYGNNMQIVVHDSFVYGQYELYEKWNEQINYFENVCTFYFYGIQRNTNSVVLKVGLPGIEVANGTLKKQGDAVILQTNFSSGYMQEDFAHGYLAGLRQRTDSFIKLGIVKDKKCFLYEGPSDAQLTKGYIVSGDFVSVFEQKDGWLKVLYISPTTSKPFRKWIKSASLYDQNPSKW